MGLCLQSRRALPGLWKSFKHSDCGVDSYFSQETLVFISTVDMNNWWLAVKLAYIFMGKQTNKQKALKQTTHSATKYGIAAAWGGKAEVSTVRGGIFVSFFFPAIYHVLVWKR